ncbi:uncharacterized protein FFNC_15714 [Fusarium fujikuroi]|nr:uncharacterized protein FFNC_15714 [Fusarium fujikuroi]
MASVDVYIVPCHLPRVKFPVRASRAHGLKCYPSIFMDDTLFVPFLTVAY